MELPPVTWPDVPVPRLTVPVPAKDETAWLKAPITKAPLSSRAPEPAALVAPSVTVPALIVVPPLKLLVPLKVRFWVPVLVNRAGAGDIAA